MADNAVRYGLKAVATQTGVPIPKPVVGYVASGYQGAVNGGGNVDINIGDPVRRLSTGMFVLAAGQEAAAGAAETIFGVVCGIKQYYDGSKIRSGNKLPGGTAYSTNLERQSALLITPAAGVIFECDCDDAATATTLAAYQALLGENVDHVLAYDAALSRANPRIDISTHVATTAQWNILNVSSTAFNQDFSGLYVKLLLTVTELQGAI